jgi:hypothetical protein
MMFILNNDRFLLSRLNRTGLPEANLRERVLGGSSLPNQITGQDRTRPTKTNTAVDR